MGLLVPSAGEALVPFFLWAPARPNTWMKKHEKHHMTLLMKGYHVSFYLTNNTRSPCTAFQVRQEWWTMAKGRDMTPRKAYLSIKLGDCRTPLLSVWLILPMQIRNIEERGDISPWEYLLPLRGIRCRLFRERFVLFKVIKPHLILRGIAILDHLCGKSGALK